MSAPRSQREKREREVERLLNGPLRTHSHYQIARYIVRRDARLLREAAKRAALELAQRQNGLSYRAVVERAILNRRPR